MTRSSTGPNDPRLNSRIAAIPSAPAIAEGFPSVFGDHDRVLELDKAAFMGVRRFYREHHAALQWF